MQRETTEALNESGKAFQENESKPGLAYREGTQSVRAGASSAKNGRIVQGTNVNGKPSKNSEPKSDALRLTLRKLLEGEFASFSISLHYFSWVCVCVHT